MIVVDASALLAVLLDEPERLSFAITIDAGPSVMSAVNYWEVLSRAYTRFGPPGRERAETLIQAFGIEVVDASPAMARAALDAFERYGRPDPGILNMGDCFAYALARRENAPLLYKGNDFARTDVTSALT